MSRARILILCAFFLAQSAISGVSPGQWLAPEPVSEINGSLFDYRPILSADNLTLYFARRFNSSDTRIFQAVRPDVDSPFGQPQEIIHTAESVMGWVSNDGLRLYYFDELATKWVPKVSQRATVNDAWPAGTIVPGFDAIIHFGHFALTDDELLVVFDSPTGLSGVGWEYNLWAADRPDRDSAFTNIRELTELSSPFDDIDPFITGDGLTIYFVSRKTGIGEVYKATRSSRQDNFSNIEQMPVFRENLPAEARFPSLTVDGRNMYLMNDGDIYVSHWRDPNLVDYWKFNEGGGSTAFDSVGGKDGQVNGATWIDGVVGGALEFDGVDGYVALPDNEPVWLPRGDLTVSLWCRFAATATRNEILFDLNSAASSSSTSRQGCAVYRLDTGPIMFTMVTGGGQLNQLQCTTPLTAGRWYHVVAVRDGATQAVYINGAEEASGVCSPDPVDYEGDYNDNHVSIGRISRSGETPSGYLNGDIDDVRIYNRGLSLKEIASLYRGGGGASKPAVYHVDAVTGSNGNDGSSRQEAFATIQKAVNMAVSGDTIEVWPGEYAETVDFRGKAITIFSADEPAVLEGGWGNAAIFHSGEGADSVLRNFIITGSATAVSCNSQSSPTLMNLTIVGNDFGIAAYENSSPDIRNCILFNNTDGDLFGCQAKYSWVQQEQPAGGSDVAGRWQFDETSGDIAHDSVGGNNAVVYGAAWANGQSGNALAFNGVSDYAEVADSPDLDMTDQMSIGVWVYIESVDGYNFVVAKQPSDTWRTSYPGNYEYRIDPITALVTFSHQTGTGSSEFQTYSSDIPVQPNVWQHITVTVVLGGQVNFYVNAVPAGTYPQIGAFGLTNNEPLRIGTRKDNAGYFHGMMDDLQIYRRVLEPADVALLFNGGLARDVGPDPLFADPNNGDFHLKSRRGRYWPQQRLWIMDDQTSPCVDGGDPAVSASKEPMPNGGRINMGAYGGTAYASRNEMTPKFRGSADINGDGIVNLLDAAIVFSHWLEESP